MKVSPLIAWAKFYCDRNIPRVGEEDGAEWVVVQHHPRGVYLHPGRIRIE